MNLHRQIWITLLGLWVSSGVVAQTGAGLVLQPWPDRSQWQLEVGAMVLNKGHTDNADARFRLEHYDASGRWRPDTDNQTLTFGFEVSHLNLSTDDPALPEQLTDQSVAAGFRLGENASLQLVLGVGYAGDNPYADADAPYGQAGLIYTHTIDPQSALRIILNYDGSRVLFPDIPLPSLVYQRQVSNAISYSIGFPVNTIHWQPAPRVSVRVVYVLPVTLNAAIEYELASGWRLFGQIDSRLDAFTLDGAPDHRRLFFQQRRIEAGVRLHSDQKIDLTLAGGYAFGQEFSTGFDVRDLDDVADISDEPYFRVAINLRF